jgi:hypothetical protein
LFGGPHHPNVHEASLETIVILIVAIPIVIRTKRIVGSLLPGGIPESLLVVSESGPSSTASPS